MKRNAIVLPILLSAALLPSPSRAQLLKSLMSKATKSLTGNTGSGKKDSSAQASTFDSAALVQRLAQMKAASAGAAAPAGPSVSPADSAAAIQAFKTATGGSGLYYQYLETYSFTNTRGKDSVFRDTMAVAITDAHLVRTSFGVLGVKMVMIARPAMPRYVVMLHSDSRTFALHIVDTAALSRGDGWTYRVTKIGTERVGVYDCTHAKVTMSKPGSKEPITEDMWTSTQVTGYATLKRLNTIRNVTPAVMKALEQAGCDGFVVKVTLHGAAYSMEMLLTQVGRKDLPASEFEIPAGYTAESRVNPYGRMFQQ